MLSPFLIESPVLKFGLTASKGRLILFFALLIIVPGCTQKEILPSRTPKPEKELSAYPRNTETLNLSNDTVYLLSTDLIIDSGKKLVIEAGTLIKAGYTSGTTPPTPAPGQKSITIKRGGIMEVNGTPSAPVVFTSSNATGAQNENWGGIVIEGKSTDNNKQPPFDINDYSATIRYCRIEFASLTLKSLGSRNILENIMISYANKNPSLTIIGGTFNARNIVSYACGTSSDLYITNGYTGSLQSLLLLRHPYFGTPGSMPQQTLTGIYLQNSTVNAPNAIPVTFPKISHMTILGPNNRPGTASGYFNPAFRVAAITSSLSSCFSISNSLFAGFPKNCWILDDFFTAEAIKNRIAGISNSSFQSVDPSNPFFLAPGVYPPFQNNVFRSFILDRSFNNIIIPRPGVLDFLTKINYINPRPENLTNKAIQSGAKYDPLFQDPYFQRYEHIGALGSADWLSGWTNFTPLTTSYNNPK